MPKTAQRTWRLRVPLQIEHGNDLRNGAAILDMLRYDASRIRRIEAGAMEIESEHPHTVARWGSFGIRVDPIP